MKTCTKCKQTLPLTCFVKNKACRDGFTTQCKTCRGAVINAGNRRRRAKQVAVAGRVPGRCDACSTQLEPGRGVRAAHWDHDHTTGEFRGWLCAGCNVALGCVKDSPERLTALVHYLLNHGNTGDTPWISA